MHAFPNHLKTDKYISLSRLISFIDKGNGYMHTQALERRMSMGNGN